MYASTKVLTLTIFSAVAEIFFSHKRLIRSMAHVFFVKCCYLWIDDTSASGINCDATKLSLFASYRKEWKIAVCVVDIGTAPHPKKMNTYPKQK